MADRVPKLPRQLREVEEKLHGIQHFPSPRLDLGPVRQTMRLMVESMLADGLGDAEIEVAVHRYVDGYVAAWVDDRRQAHDDAVRALDLLEVPVQQVLYRLDALHDDVHSELQHMEGAVTHVIDRIADPDVPFRDPFPHQRQAEG